MIQSQLDTSVLIGTGIVLLFGLIGIVLSIAGGWFAASWWGGVAGVVSSLVVMGLALTLVWFPFGYAYNHYVPYSGTVTAVNTRLIGDGSGGTTQYWAIWFGSHPYKCADTRCGVLKPGAQVTLLCEKEFQFNAPQEGYVCNWGKLGLN